MYLHRYICSSRNWINLRKIRELEQSIQSRASRQQLEEHLAQLEGLVSQLVAEKGEQAHAQDRSHSEGISKRNPSKGADELLADAWKPTIMSSNRLASSPVRSKSMWVL
jgi:hypothetical protein